MKTIWKWEVWEDKNNKKMESLKRLKVWKDERYRVQKYGKMRSFLFKVWEDEKYERTFSLKYAKIKFEMMNTIKRFMRGSWYEEGLEQRFDRPNVQLS